MKPWVRGLRHFHAQGPRYFANCPCGWAFPQYQTATTWRRALDAAFAHAKTHRITQPKEKS